MSSSKRRGSQSQENDSSGISHSHHYLTPEEEKRYRFLLGQTDLLDQFLEAKQQGRSPLDILVSPQLQHHPAGSQPAQRREKKAAGKRLKVSDEDEDLEADINKAEDKTPSPQPGVVFFTESPQYVEGGTMRPYQVQGLNWLVSLYENGINGILADEMGLGKTLQTLSLLGYLKFFRNVPGPHLLVAPKSTLPNWLNEARRWVPRLSAFIFHGDKETRQQLIKSTLLNPTRSWDMCITSYEICLLEKSSLRRLPWHYLVIDEAHRIKNEHSLLSQIVREFPSRHRLLITGTPLQNNLHELWALLNFLLPDIFSSSEDFDRWFQERADISQDTVIMHLKKLLQPFLLRRLKADVEHTLLSKKEVHLYVGLTPLQRTWYRQILEREVVTVVKAADGSNNSVGSGREEKKTRLLNIVMQLRKCCNHPYLFEGAEPGPPFTTGEHLVQNAGKMQLLDSLLKSLRDKGSRVLLFSQMSRVLDILEDYCLYRGFLYCRIDGQTDHEQRIEAIEQFNRPGSDKFIFLLTTRAGGLGINLATADIVILYDSDWNPQVDLQAQDRAHRIGQTKQVCVFRLITEGTVEEKVLERALQKLRLDQLVIQQGKLTNANKALTSEEILAMIKHGVSNVLSSQPGRAKEDGGEESGEGNAIDLAEILARGEQKTKELQSRFQNADLEDILAMDSTSTPILDNGNDQGDDDEDAEALRSAAERARQQQLQELQQPTRRERKAAQYVVDGYYREVFGQLAAASKKEAAPPAQPMRPPMPKNHVMLEHQFFPPDLKPLVEKEIYAHQRTHKYRYPPDHEDASKQPLIDGAVSWTAEDAARKERLWAQGFPSWGKKDLQTFVKACERHGRDDLEAIAGELPDKPLAEVARYAGVFWQRYSELAEHQRYLQNIERGEQRLAKMAKVRRLLRSKLRNARLQLDYAGNPGRHYTHDEDLFILRTLDRVGVGSEDAYEQVRRTAIRSDVFGFDWFLKTRSAVELQRRGLKLIGILERMDKANNSNANSKR
jgi:superfamily II DNA or RNA helicase